MRHPIVPFIAELLIFWLWRTVEKAEIIRARNVQFLLLCEKGNDTVLVDYLGRHEELPTPRVTDR